MKRTLSRTTSSRRVPRTASNSSLAKSWSSGEATYPVCLKDDTSLKDGFVEQLLRRPRERAREHVTIYSQSAAESPLLAGLPPDHFLELLGIPRTMDFDF